MRVDNSAGKGTSGTNKFGSVNGIRGVLHVLRICANQHFRSVICKLAALEALAEQLHACQFLSWSNELDPSFPM